MEYAVVCLTAFIASGLTLFSGFGLGTILMPALALFFPIPVAVGATAVVHLANNGFKMFLVGRSADKGVVVRFGLPAVLAAFLGAFLLARISSFPELASYPAGGRQFVITADKLVIGLLIVFFAALELTPAFARISIGQRYMAFGGLLSGFFGGLSGNQGAFRSMFLIKAGLDKEKFIGTNVAIAVMVDIGRLTVYGAGLHSVYWSVLAEAGGLVLAATFAAFAGAFIGKMILNKVTLKAVRTVVGAMLIIMGAALSLGVI
jgi:uncharacterized membrane protein YfcA